MAWFRTVLLCLVCLHAIAVPSAVAGQVTPADSAAVLLQTAQEFEREGESEIAAALYIHITERYPNTPAAVEAHQRLTGDPGRFDPVSRLWDTGRADALMQGLEGDDANRFGVDISGHQSQRSERAF